MGNYSVYTLLATHIHKYRREIHSSWQRSAFGVRNFGQGTGSGNVPEPLMLPEVFSILQTCPPLL